MGPLWSGLPWTSQHVYPPRVYYNHKQKQNICFELVAKKSQWSLPFTVRDAFRLSFSHSRRVQQQVGWGETQQKMTGDKLRVGKKAHIFSKPKAWESAPLYLCFSVSGRQSPSHKGGQVYWALDGIRKTARGMWSKSEFCVSCDGVHASVSGGCSQALLVDLTPAHGPFKVGETRTRESKGKKARKRHKRQTGGDKKKEVLWCLVYIPQPSLSILRSATYTIILSRSLQTILSATNKQQDRFLRRCWHRFPVETNGARWQFRTKQIPQVMCWPQWRTGSWIALQEMTKGKIKHLHGLQRGGQLDGKPYAGRFITKWKAGAWVRGLMSDSKKLYSPLFF